MRAGSSRYDTKMETATSYYPKLSDINDAKQRLRGIAAVTPLMENLNLSTEYESHIMLKREDLQVVRSYKIRGAYNKMSSLTEAELANGIVCASAGNHAQGVAYSCRKMKVHGTIFMPTSTPNQKIGQVNMFGGEYVKVELVGDTYDEAYAAGLEFCEAEESTFIHPFNDAKVIEGQATVGLEILGQTPVAIDYIFLPVGGGGLSAGVSSVFKSLSPSTKIIGVEPMGAPSMSLSIKNGVNTKLEKYDKFIDGAAVGRVGDLNFEICRQNLDDMLTVPEGRVCQVILDLYNKDAIVAEPAGALALAAIDQYRDQIKGKNVVVLISGSNNDITRTAEIRERALLYGGLKHYFIVRFPQRPGALKDFVSDILGPDDDITHFQYQKKHNREKGPALVGIELKHKSDLNPLVERMKANNFYGEYLNEKPDLYQFLV